MKIIALIVLIVLIVLAFLVLSFLGSLIMGAIKWAIIIGVALFLWGVIKTWLGTSSTTS